jgi:hypothetical protein
MRIRWDSAVVTAALIAESAALVTMIAGAGWLIYLGLASFGFVLHPPRPGALGLALWFSIITLALAAGLLFGAMTLLCLWWAVLKLGPPLSPRRNPGPTGADWDLAGPAGPGAGRPG